MRADRIGGLLQLCRAARDAGRDFPDIWANIIEKHPLVVSIPRQTHEGEEPVLEIRLITGARLVFRRGSFSIE